MESEVQKSPLAGIPLRKSVASPRQALIADFGHAGYTDPEL